MTTYYLITFDSTHLAIKVERLLKETLKIMMLPTPREIHSSCGLAVQIQEQDFKAAVNLLKKTEVDGMHLYVVTRELDGPRTYTAVDWSDVDANGYTNWGHS